MKNYIPLCILSICLLFSSCQIGNLELQKNFKYHYTQSDPNIYMTAYEFVESRKNIDMFVLLEAIDYAEMREEFETEDRTYVLLNDVAMRSYLNDKKYTSIRQMTRAQVQDLLQSYILYDREKYHALNLTTTPIKAECLNTNAVMYISLRPEASDVPNQWQVMLNIRGYMGSTREVYVITSNIIANNGLIHVVETYPEFRTN